MRRIIQALLFVSYLSPLVIAADIDLTQDLRARRARLMEHLGPDNLLIIQSGPTRTYSADVDYEYRQDSNFYYLTGLEEPGATLVLMPGNATRKEILFLAPTDPARVRYVGPGLSDAEARQASGIGTVLPSTRFEPFVASMLSRRFFALDPNWSIAADDPAAREYSPFLDALAAGRARVSFIVEPRSTLSDPPSATIDLANKLRARFFGFSLTDESSTLEGLRQIKTTYEQKVLEESAAISTAAHQAAMRVARPGAYEYEVESALEAVYLARGASGWSYPSIVASGPNATVLHYEKSSRRMEPGDLLLLDAAANYHYMTVDITRTYPVNGVFTPEQKAVHRFVVAAQEEGMKVAAAGGTLRDVDVKVTEAIKDGLLKLGLITDTQSDQYRTWYYHSAIHFIGIDVHDPGSIRRRLVPGMAFVIEPGIYVRASALDELPDTPQNAEFRVKVRTAHEKYKNIGVRIEDSFLVTSSGLKRLSAGVPRTVEEIEAHFRLLTRNR
jgi:Xaa-Pro aminopeptidase